MPKISLGSVYFGLQLTACLGRTSRQAHKRELKLEEAEKCFLPDCSPWLAQFELLTLLRTVCLGTTLPRVNWTFPHQSFIFIFLKNAPQAYQVEGGVFSIKIPSPEMARVCAKLP